MGGVTLADLLEREEFDFEAASGALWDEELYRVSQLPVGVETGASHALRGVVLRGCLLRGGAFAVGQWCVLHSGPLLLMFRLPSPGGSYACWRGRG